MTWPIWIIDRLVNDPALAEKIFVVYLFSVFVTLAYIFSIQLLRLLGKYTGIPLRSWRGEVFISFVVALCFANFWSLQQLADLYYTSIIEFMLIGISLTLILSPVAGLKSVALGGTALSFCILLDPNLYPFGFLTLSLATFATTLSRRGLIASLRKSVTRVSILFAVSLPALLTMLYVLNETTGTTLRTKGAYLISTSNLQLSNAVRLIGYWWSLIAYAPPSILWSNAVSQEPAAGSPPYMVLPTGPLTTFWLATTWFVPVFAFSVFVLKRYRRISMPIGLISLIGLLLTQPSIFPIPYLLAGYLSGVPLLGGALLTVFAIPDHILIMIAISYVILIGAGTHFLLTKTTRRATGSTSDNFYVKAFKGQKIRANPLSRALVIGGVFVLLLFPSWQLFSGSFFPSGYAPGISGNGIPTLGSFSPSKVPQAMLDTYNWMLDQSGNFNIYWPGPEGATYLWNNKSSTSIAQVDSPKETFLTQAKFPAALQYLLRSNLTVDLAPYLAALNIKYIVLQPYSKTGLEYSWGIDDFQKLQTIIHNARGLSLVRSQDGILVYSVSNPWGPIYSPDLVLGYGVNDEEYAISYGILESLGVHAAISDQRPDNAGLCFENSGCALSILSPSMFASYLPSQTSLRALSGTRTELSSYTLGPSDFRSLPSPDTSWTVTNWGESPVHVDVESTMRWTMNNQSVLTLSYNGTVTDGNPGGLTVPSGSIPIVRISFSYRTSSYGDISLRVLIPVLNSGLVTSSIPQSSEFPRNGAWTTAAFNVTLPSNAAIFTSRIQATGTNGWVEIRDVSVNVTMATPNIESPFGMVLHVSSSNPMPVSTHSGYTYLQVAGNGTISQNGENHPVANQTRFGWLNLYSSEEAQFTISGSVAIACIVVTQLPLPTYAQNAVENLTDTSVSLSRSGGVVLTRTFARAYSLTNGSGLISSSPTLDGLNLFVGVGSGTHRVLLVSVVPSWIMYGVTMVANLSILLVVFRKKIVPTLRFSRRGSAFGQAPKLDES